MAADPVIEPMPAVNLEKTLSVRIEQQEVIGGSDQKIGCH
jgi:hypothetical protein